MKQYEAPVFDVIKLVENDVITLSGDEDAGKGTAADPAGLAGAADGSVGVN